MPHSSVRRVVHLTVAFLLCSPIVVLQGCDRKPSAVRSPYQALARTDFNRRVVELNLPLFWREDLNNDGTLQPGELAVLTGYSNSDRPIWIDADGKFTSEFASRYRQAAATDKPIADAAAAARHRLVVEELAQGRPTLVETDLSQASAADKNLVAHLLNAARSIERLYARQNGVFGMESEITPGDTASQALFRRNQSPYCKAPRTEKEAACSALKTKPPVIVGLYPAEIQSEPGFCERLAKERNAAALTGHFSTVVNGDQQGSFKALPYPEAYPQDMFSVAGELEAAAKGLGDDEAALKAYLNAAAASFRSNDWEPADAAWVAMNAQNSKWYVRIAPDEVYFEPCAWKAGFALQLARINPDSLEWQQKLDPLKREMENTLAGMAGAPYQARDVQFRIPDFIDVVLNAGDQRSPHGATIGQSLPNWGPVAQKGGRTVAMTNLYTDADSRGQAQAQMSSLFCKATGALITTTPRESLIASVLHEAAHNLGPSHEYKVKGREDDQIFGGTMASTLEELKAQTSAMFLTYWLAEKGVSYCRRSQQNPIAQCRMAIRTYLAWHVHSGGHTPQLQPALGNSARCAHGRTRDRVARRSTRGE